MSSQSDQSDEETPQFSNLVTVDENKFSTEPPSAHHGPLEVSSQRDMGACIANVTNTKYFLEELVPQRVPGPIGQQNVQPDLSACPDWNEVKHYLPAAIVDLKVTAFAESAQATVLKLLREGSAQVPSIHAVGVRMVRALSRVQTQDKTSSRLTRQHVLTALIAAQQPAPPIQYISMLVDKAFPTLDVPSRELILQSVCSHTEDLAVAVRAELERQQQCVVACYEVDQKYVTELDAVLSELGLTEQATVNTAEGPALARALMLNCLVQLQRMHHAARLRERFLQRQQALRRRQQRMDAFLSSAALAQEVPFFARDGTRLSSAPLSAEHRELLTQAFWRDLRELDFIVAGDLRSLAEEPQDTAEGDEDVFDEDESHDISLFTYSNLRKRKLAAFARVLDVIATARAQDMGITADGDKQAEAASPSSPTPAPASAPTSPNPAAEPRSLSPAPEELFPEEEPEAEDKPSAALLAGLPAGVRASLEEEYATQLTHLLLMQDETLKESSARRVEVLKASKAYLRQVRALLREWLEQLPLRVSAEDAVARVCEKLQAYSRVAVEAEDDDHDLYVSFVEGRVAHHLSDIAFLQQRVAALPDTEMLAGVRERLSLLLGDAVHYMEGHALSHLDHLRDEYEWVYAAYVNSPLAGGHYDFVPVVPGAPSSALASGAQLDALDVFGVRVPVQALPCPVAWLGDHVAILGTIDEPHVLTKAQEAASAFLAQPTRATPTGLWDLAEELRDMHACYQLLAAPVPQEWKRAARMAVRQDAELSAYYRLHLELLRQAFSPHDPQLKTWFDGDTTQGVFYCMYPPLPTLAYRLTEAARAHPAAPGVAPSQQLLTALEEGEATLAPGAYAGFLDRLAWAAGALAFCEETMPEATKLVRGPALCDWQRKIFEKAFTDTFPSHRVDMVPDLQLPPTVPAIHQLSPKFTIEPVPTYLLRLLLAFRFLRAVLVRVFGPALRCHARLTASPSDAMHGGYTAQGLLVAAHRISVFASQFSSAFDAWGSLQVTAASFGVAARKPAREVRADPLTVRFVSGVEWQREDSVVTELYDVERVLLGLYLSLCQEMGLQPADLAKLSADHNSEQSSKSATAARDDEDYEEEEEGDDDDDAAAAVRAQTARALAESERENAFDDGYDLSIESWHTAEDCVEQAREWVAQLKQDADVGGDRRGMRLHAQHTATTVGGVLLAGWTRKLVAVGFHSLPRVVDVKPEVDAVIPEEREDGKYLSCPRCGWELRVPALDESGVFKCSGDACVDSPEALLVQLDDGAVAPIELQLEHVWVWYPVQVAVETARKWSAAEVRAICETKHTEAAVRTSLKTFGVEKEPLGGLQAMVPYEVIQELNAWFKDIDKHSTGRLSRARIKAYFAVSSGEAGFYSSGDTMFYFMDRNQDGWVGVAEFRVSILHIYREAIGLLRVEKISSLRQKFNQLYIQRQEALAEERSRSKLTAQAHQPQYADPGRRFDGARRRPF